MDHYEQDWNYLLHFGTFKKMLLEGKIDEDMILEYVEIWRRQKCWNGFSEFLGIDGEQFIHLAYHPNHIREILSIDNGDELINKFPANECGEHAKWLDEWRKGVRRNQYVCKKCGCHLKKINGKYVCWNCGSRKITKKEWWVVE